MQPPPKRNHNHPLQPKTQKSRSHLQAMQEGNQKMSMERELIKKLGQAKQNEKSVAYDRLVAAQRALEQAQQEYDQAVNADNRMQALFAQYENNELHIEDLLSL